MLIAYWIASVAIWVVKYLVILGIMIFAHDLLKLKDRWPKYGYKLELIMWLTVGIVLWSLFTYIIDWFSWLLWVPIIIGSFTYAYKVGGKAEEKIEQYLSRDSPDPD